MIKKFKYSTQRTALCLVALAFTALSPVNAYAQVCSVGQVATANSTSATVNSDIFELSTKLKTLEKKITTRLELFKQSVVAALSGVSQSVTNASVNKITADAKALDAFGTQELQRELRHKNAETAMNVAPLGIECVQATGKQYTAEVDFMTKGIAQAIHKDTMDTLTGVGGSLSVAAPGNQSANTISYQAALFEYMMANFCNPASNGGLMPTQANPIETASGPLWCGRDRGGEDELVDLHLRIPGLLLEPSALQDSPKIRTGAAVSLVLMLGLPMDKTSLPSLDTAAGRSAFDATTKQMIRKSLSAKYLSKKLANIFSSASNEASDWVREIHIMNLGSNPPPELLAYIDEKYDGNLSKSQFLEATVDLYTGSQAVLGVQGASPGQYQRQIINLTSMLNYLKSKNLQEAEATNLFSAVIAGNS